MTPNEEDVALELTSEKITRDHRREQDKNPDI